MAAIHWHCALVWHLWFSLVFANTGNPLSLFPWSRHGQVTKTENAPVSRSFFLELEELSRLVDIAYCVGLQGPGIQDPFSCPSHCDDFPNVALITTFNTGQLLADSCGYIALDHGNQTESKSQRIIVAFRGSYSISNAIVDLSTIPQEYVPFPDDGGNGSNPNATKCESCSVHLGFYQSWKNAREVILPYIEQAAADYPSYQLVIVGHSLGGAVATLAGLELQAKGFDPVVTTFGEPKIGNQGLADFIDGQFGLVNSTTSSKSGKLRRLTHNGDPVPHLPLEEWGYVPHSGEIYISKADLPPEPEDLRVCNGPKDLNCSIGPEGDWSRFPWGLPARYKIWELLWAHRDYFWRLGLCLGHDHDAPRLKDEF